MLLQSIRPENCGIIVRTVAQEKGAADLHSDFEELSQPLEGIAHQPAERQTQTAHPWGDQQDQLPFAGSADADFSQILVNDPEVAERSEGIPRGIAPDKVDIVKESKAKDVFDDRGVHRMIKASFGRQVNLRSGAYLIVEHTEAMHVIDVNSGGRKAGATSQEENAMATNLECSS